MRSAARVVPEDVKTMRLCGWNVHLRYVFFHAMSHGKRIPLCGHVGCIHVKMPGLTRVQHKTEHVDGSINPQQSCMKTMTCTRNASGYRFSFGKHVLNRLKRLEQRNPLAYIQHDWTLKPNVSFTINMMYMMYIWVTWAHPHGQSHLPGPSTQALVHLHLDLMVSQEFTRRKYLSCWISCIPIHLINMDPARKPWKDSYQCPLDLLQTSNVKAMILNEIIRSMVKKKAVCDMVIHRIMRIIRMGM